jgi:hypothetical protein
MLRKCSIRRFVIAGMVLGTLAAATPAASLAANAGGGPRPTPIQTP